MSKKLYWGLGILIGLLIVFTLYVHYDYAKFMDNLDSGRDKPHTDAAEVSDDQPGVEHAGGHEHPDGTFHEGGSEDPLPEGEVLDEVTEKPKVQYTAPKGAVLTPEFPEIDPKEDPVKAAFKRLEYIKNNPYAWGGVHSERATELIAELMPPRMSMDHADGDEKQELLAELTNQNDPRTGEVLIANMCEGSVGGTWLTNELVGIGPPAVPYILPYLDKGMEQGGYIRLVVFDSLGSIVVRYRSDLGGIVDHIIIPKFKAILADEDFEHYRATTVRYAREALEKLQQNIKE